MLSKYHKKRLKNPKSHVFEHHHKCGHKIDFDNVKNSRYG